jgi:N-acetylmuramoyl-L-alanine amidase
MEVLKKGSKGESVKTLQEFLKITVDGDFGPKTESAVKHIKKKLD